MLEAANAAAAIAADNTAKTGIQPIGKLKLKNLYAIDELSTSADLKKKINFIKEANQASKNYESRNVRFRCEFGLGLFFSRRGWFPD